MKSPVKAIRRHKESPQDEYKLPVVAAPAPQRRIQEHGFTTSNPGWNLPPTTEGSTVADITKSKILRLSHFKGSPLSWVVRYKKGKDHESGYGLSFYFRKVNTVAIAVPTDDREITFVFQGRSSDYQQVTVQGTVTFRIARPDQAAKSIDFTVNLSSGDYKENPELKLENLITQLCQQYSFDYISSNTVRDMLTNGALQLRGLISSQLGQDSALVDAGITVVSVRVSSVKPSPDVEKVLQTPQFEKLGETSDEASFSRRASAVEKQHAIDENEQKNKIALSKQEADLIDQQAENERTRNENRILLARQTSEASAEQNRITAQGAADAARMGNEAEADGIRLIKDAENEAQAHLMDIYKEMDASTLFALAFQKLGDNFGSVQSLQLSPSIVEQLAPLFNANGNGAVHEPAQG